MNIEYKMNRLRRKLCNWLPVFGPRRLTPAMIRQKFPLDFARLEALFVEAIRSLPQSDSLNLRESWKAVLESTLASHLQSGGLYQSLIEDLTVVSNARHKKLRLRSTKAFERGSLNILFVTAVFPDVNHGGGLRVVDMISELASRGHKISLYSVEPGGGNNSSHALDNFLQSKRYVRSRNFTPHDYASWLSQEGVRFDSIHYIWPGSSPLIEMGAAWAKRSIFELIESCTRRLLMDVEQLLKEKNIDEMPFRVLDMISHWKLEGSAVSLADEVVALTDVDAAFTSELFDIPIPPVIPTCVSRNFVMNLAGGIPDTTPQHGRFSVFFIGNFDHYPNTDGIRWYVEKVHPLVLSQMPTYRLVVAGAGNTTKLRRVAQGVDGVQVIGRVDDLVGAIASADICIAPLVSGAGIRGKLLQYSYVGRPVVSTSIGISGTPYVQNESVLVTDDPVEFASNVVRLLTDRELYSKLRINARRMVEEHFEWGRQIERLEKIYEGSL